VEKAQGKASCGASPHHRIVIALASCLFHTHTRNPHSHRTYRHNFHHHSTTHNGRPRKKTLGSHRPAPPRGGNDASLQSSHWYVPPSLPPRPCSPSLCAHHRSTPTGLIVVSSRRRSAFQPCSRPLVPSSSSSPFAPSRSSPQRQHDHLEGGRRWQLLPLAAAGGKGFGKKSSKEGEGESSKQQPAQQGTSKVGYCR